MLHRMEYYENQAEEVMGHEVCLREEFSVAKCSAGFKDRANQGFANLCTGQSPVLSPRVLF